MFTHYFISLESLSVCLQCLVSYILDISHVQVCVYVRCPCQSSCFIDGNTIMQTQCTYCTFILKQMRITEYYDNNTLKSYIKWPNDKFIRISYAKTQQSTQQIISLLEWAMPKNCTKHSNHLPQSNHNTIQYTNQHRTQ